MSNEQLAIMLTEKVRRLRLIEKTLNTELLKSKKHVEYFKPLFGDAEKPYVPLLGELDQYIDDLEADVDNLLKENTNA